MRESIMAEVVRKPRACACNRDCMLTRCAGVDVGPRGGRPARSPEADGNPPRPRLVPTVSAIDALTGAVNRERGLHTNRSGQRVYPRSIRVRDADKP